VVFKKPYAFLIKNFKIIHIILSLMIVFIVFQYSKISTFFGDYVRDSAGGIASLAGANINGFLYLAILLVVVFALLMFLLMQNKQKPTTFYMLALGYYSILLVAVIYAANIMSTLDQTQLTMQVARAYRDIYLMILFPQFYFLIMSTIRGVGFDVKKFNFGKDLQELEIEAKDNEEFEFVLGTDTHIYGRKLRRIFRELKYYFLENKLIILGIIGVIVLSFSTYFLINITFINKVYYSGSRANLGGFTYKLNSAYLTQYDYNGNLIKEGSLYIIANMSVTNNNSSIARRLERITLFLNVEGKNVHHQPSLRNHFIDMGKSYINEEINPNTTKDLLFIFEIDDDISIRTFTMKILDTIEIGEDNQAVYNYVDYKVATRNLNTAPTRIEKTINELMFLGNGMYNDSSLKITDIEALNKYEFKYDSCNAGECKKLTEVVTPTNAINNSLLIISYELNMAEEISILSSMKTHKYFFDHFLTLEFNKGAKILRQDFTTATYPALPNKVFAEIPKSLLSGNMLNIIIKTREYHNSVDFSKIIEKNH